jgi:hypothetical protein
VAPEPPVAGDPVHVAATTVYHWACRFQEELRAEGRELPREGRLALDALFDALNNPMRRIPGEEVDDVG